MFRKRLEGQKYLEMAFQAGRKRKHKSLGWTYGVWGIGG
jgi:hypothetical protein